MSVIEQEKTGILRANAFEINNINVNNYLIFNILNFI
jgi:hypothetical protein